MIVEVIIFSLWMGGCSHVKDINGGNGQAADSSNIYNTISEPWETIFHGTSKTRYEVPSRSNNDFRIILNRYQNPLPMIQFDWKGYTVCYYDYSFITHNGVELGNVVQIKKGTDILYDLRGDCYFNGFIYDIEDYRSGKADPYLKFFRDVTGDGEPELIVCVGTHGAYSYWTMYIFRLTSTGPENILEYYSGRVGTLQTPEADKEWDARWNDDSWDIFNKLRCYIRDIDGNGTPEMIMANSVIEHLCGATHGPHALTILEWNGTRFVDNTRKFPGLARKAALGYADDSLNEPFCTENQYGFICDVLMPYYANMILAGEENKARSWIRRNGSGEIIQWLDDKKKIQSIHDALDLKNVGNKIKRGRKYVY
jgi:hypothetical protein